MVEMDKEKIIKNGQETYQKLFYEASRLSKLVEELDIDENSVNKDDVVEIDYEPTVENTEFNTIYLYEDKLYKKISGDYDDKVLCYTDIFLQLADVNNRLLELSNTLDELEDTEEEKK
jgi:hypothetical protein